MELVKQKAKCCGCRTCEHVCPKAAITMERDEKGFFYPVIDEQRCVNCGLCLKKCAFQSGSLKRKEFDPFYGYAARHKDMSTMMESRSGGAFTAISDVTLSQGGSVYGAGFDKESRFSRVIHKKAVTSDERNEFRGSKYIQSDLNTVFPEIKRELAEGRQVLFTGVGCQVGALHAYLGKEYDNLLTVDILCHGVVSPKVWADLLKMRELELDGKVSNADFRDKKKNGWKGNGESIWIEKKKYSSRLFSKIYSKALGYRPSCHQCQYTNQDRAGDITIGDFWGIENAVPEFGADNKGVSLVLVNTSKGKKIWEIAAKEMDVVETTGYPYRHTAMKVPTRFSAEEEAFWKDYNEKGFVYVMKKYCNYEPDIPDTKELIMRKLRKVKRKLKAVYSKKL